MSKTAHDLNKITANYTRALTLLESGTEANFVSPILLAGVIKAFEMNFELCWKALRALLLRQGVTANAPREVFVQAYGLGLISGEEVWLAMLKDRNETVHTYNEALALAMNQRIKKQYLPLFKHILAELQSLCDQPGLE